MSSRGPSAFSDYQWVSLTDGEYKLIVHSGDSGFTPLGTDMFFDLSSDPDEEHNLVDEGMNSEQHQNYLCMRDAVVDYWPSSVCEPTSVMVDVPLTDALALSSKDDRFEGVLPVGHLRPGTGQATEYRIFLRFDIEQIDDLLPPDRTLEDVESTQIIVRFRSDSSESDETDTGLIHARPATRNWYENTLSWDDLDDSFYLLRLGMVDIAPHVLPGAYGSLPPLQANTPVSLGHSERLLDIVRFWKNFPALNYGVVMIADPVEEIGGDQRISFFPEAVLRLTLRQD